MSNSINMSNIELYAFLGLNKFASVTEIKKAYKKSALKLHPDKNPNRPKAAEEFQKLQKVFETLTDIVKKAEYDQSLKAKEQVEKRFAEMDAKTRYFKKEMEEKEKKYQLERQEKQRIQREKEELIERMRQEGRKRLREEDERHARMEEEARRKRIEEEMRRRTREAVPDGYNVKASWKVFKKDIQPAYTTEEIRNIFVECGEILEIIKSNRKEGLYLINFLHQQAALDSISIVGKESRPLKVTSMLKPEMVHPNSSFNSQKEEERLPKEEERQPDVSFEELLNKFKQQSQANQEKDKETELPLKYVYPGGYDALFACARTFQLPPDIKLKPGEEVVYGGYRVRLNPSCH